MKPRTLLKDGGIGWADRFSPTNSSKDHLNTEQIPQKKF